MCLTEEKAFLSKTKQSRARKSCKCLSKPTEYSLSQNGEWWRESHASCKICNSFITVLRGGKNDISQRKYRVGKKHAKEGQRLFLENPPEVDPVINAEVRIVMLWCKFVFYFCDDFSALVFFYCVFCHILFTHLSRWTRSIHNLQ